MIKQSNGASPPISGDEEGQFSNREPAKCQGCEYAAICRVD